MRPGPVLVLVVALALAVGSQPQKYLPEESNTLNWVKVSHCLRCPCQDTVGWGSRRAGHGLLQAHLASPTAALGPRAPRGSWPRGLRATAAGRPPGGGEGS